MSEAVKGSTLMTQTQSGKDGQGSQAKRQDNSSRALERISLTRVKRKTMKQQGLLGRNKRGKM